MTMAQLFKGLFALIQGYMLIPVSLILYSKAFFWIIFTIRHAIIKLETKRHLY